MCRMYQDISQSRTNIGFTIQKIVCHRIYKTIDNAHYLNKYTANQHNHRYYAKINVFMYIIGYLRFVIG